MEHTLFIFKSAKNDRYFKIELKIGQDPHAVFQLVYKHL